MNDLTQSDSHIPPSLRDITLCPGDNLTSSRFPDRLTVTPRDNDPEVWVLESEFRYKTRVGVPAVFSDKSIYATITVPKGFETNFASTPRLLWSILPPYGTYGKAAVVHDFLYSTHPSIQKYTRKQSDNIFLEAMKILGVPFWKRQSMYRAVRIAGWAKFRKGA